MARARTNTPTRPDDPRTYRSIEALRSAFLTLLETTPLDQISIKAITEAAGLSYPTFFRRFASREELLEDIAAGEVRNLLEYCDAAMSYQREAGALDDLCRYVESRRTLWATLLTGGAASAMREEFIRHAVQIGRSRPRANPWLPADLGPPFVTSGIFEILAWWMRQPEDYPVQNVMKLFNALIFENVGRHRDIDLV